MQPHLKDLKSIMGSITSENNTCSMLKTSSDRLRMFRFSTFNGSSGRYNSDLHQMSIMTHQKLSPWKKRWSHLDFPLSTSLVSHPANVESTVNTSYKQIFMSLTTFLSLNCVSVGQIVEKMIERCWVQGYQPCGITSFILWKSGRVKGISVPQWLWGLGNFCLNIGACFWLPHFKPALCHVLPPWGWGGGSK